ncbi:hypothetical protein DVVG_00027 [Dunaliella viridis virus SI2]|uniref:hypothetical protein n=1 Tax=Dunaliella viridis virus SI2 TaxID=754069 RepID=UPI0002C09A7C|nr:hypothetical protein DVVG_00027 [Dunaliella viridis virus SI2]AGH16013.1 hypothetical protein DVVG_00027 [Dunaliella viridis virus SI2]
MQDKPTPVTARQPDYSILPGHMRDGMRLYIEKGIKPGEFLTALLSNDFMDACRRADDINLYALPNYARFFYSELPAVSFGSPERVQEWIAGGGLEGRRLR